MQILSRQAGSPGLIWQEILNGLRPAYIVEIGLAFVNRVISHFP